MNRPIILLLFVFAIACGKKDKRGDENLTGDVEPVVAPAQPVHEDPGPTLKRRTGALAPQVRPTSTAAVDRWEKRDGYVIATIPLETDGLPSAGTRTSWVVDAGDQHAAAFGWSGSDLSNPQRGKVGLIVRVRGAALPNQFTVRWTQTDSGSWGERRLPGTMGTITVSVPPKVPIAAGLDEVFWSSAATHFSGSRSGFSGYAHQRAQFLAAGTTAAKPGFAGQQRRSDMQQMMELYSGMTSVNEALQADRGLLVRGEDVAQRTVPIAQITRIEMPAHPWERMITDLGAQPVVEPLAAYVPADMAYLHFGDLRTLVKLVAELDGWLSPVAQWLEERGGASHFMSRYEDQLVLERTGLAEKLGHVAVKDLAVVVSDPLLREGTDVSVIFRIANREALVAALGVFEARARGRHDQIATASMIIDGVTVQRLSTTDQAVNQYRAEYGDVLTISNSVGALTQLIRAHKGVVARLSEQGDFRYMRTVYPWLGESEHGFVFMGDAFVARVISPEMKILQARRMDAQADLLALNYAALLRGWVDGTRSKSGQELVDAKYVRKEELRHVDLAPITFNESGGAMSEYGTVARLAPIRDLERGLKNASPAEVEAYDRFRQTYQSYWRSFIDPIAARIDRSEDGKALSVDARMLPLIDVSEYDRILAEVGQQTVLGPDDGPGMQWTLAIGKDAKLRRSLDGIAKGVIPGDKIGINWLGDWVSFGVADRGGLWDMALITGLVPALDEPRRLEAGLEMLSTFPIYAAVHVASRIGLAALLTGLRGWVSDSAPGMVSWGQGEPYRDIPVVTISEGSGSPREFRDLTIHYATVDDVFVVAFNRATLLGLIDRCLAGDMPKAPTGPPSAAAEHDAQAVINVNPGPGGYLAKTVMGVAEIVLLAKHGQIMDDYEVLWRGLGGGGALTADALREFGVAYVGREPRSPHGGTFSIVDGFPTHSVYGDSVRPIMPEVPVAGSPITDVISRLGALRMTLEAEGEGDSRGLHTTVDWRWK